MVFKSLTNGNEFDKSTWIETDINIAQTINGLISGKIYKCAKCGALELGKQNYCHTCGKRMENGGLDDETHSYATNNQ